MKISPPAYPTHLIDSVEGGMSLRDYIATAAMAGKLSANDKELSIAEIYRLSVFAYAMADAMMNEKNS